MRIAHLADLHLGYRAYHRSTSQGLNVREADVANAFERAVERIVQLAPDMVVVAGDVFHSSRPPNSAIAQAFRQVGRLRRELPGAPVLIVGGNHDSPRSSDTENILTLLTEIEGVHVVARGSRRIRLPELDASVLCVSDNALDGDEHPAIETDDDARTNVLLLHGTVGGAGTDETVQFLSEVAGERVIRADEIQPERWDYVALGHYHLATELAPNMWYAGSLERVAPNLWAESEHPKGFVLFDTDTGRAEFEPIEVRPLLDLPRQSAEGMSAEEVDALVDIVVSRIPGGAEDKIVRLVIEDLPRAVYRRMDHERLRRLKAEALHFHLDTRPPQRTAAQAQSAAVTRKTLGEHVEAHIAGWRPSSDRIDRDRLVRVAQEFLSRAEAS